MTDHNRNMSEAAAWREVENTVGAVWMPLLFNIPFVQVDADSGLPVLICFGDKPTHSLCKCNGCEVDEVEWRLTPIADVNTALCGLTYILGIQPLAVISVKKERLDAR